MLNLFRRKLENQDSLLAFLNEADEALIKAYETKQLTELGRFATNKVLCDVTDKLSSSSSVLFGTKTYRIRKWTILSSDGNCYVVKKELRHQHVKISKEIYIAIGEDIDEIWKVLKQSDKFLIGEIKGVA